MANPIEQRIKELAPDLQVTKKMQRDMARNPDPDGTASNLEGRIKDWRNDLAKEIAPNFDPELVPFGLILSKIDLSKNFKGYATGTGGKLAQLGREDNFGLGRHVGFQEGLSQKRELTPSEFVAAIYELALGRSADGSGFKHYLDRLVSGGDGNSLFDIFRDIWLSPEAREFRGEAEG